MIRWEPNILMLYILNKKKVYNKVASTSHVGVVHIILTSMYRILISTCIDDELNLVLGPVHPRLDIKWGARRLPATK